LTPREAWTRLGGVRLLLNSGSGLRASASLDSTRSLDPSRWRHLRRPSRRCLNPFERLVACPSLNSSRRLNLRKSGIRRSYRGTCRVQSLSTGHCRDTRRRAIGTREISNTARLANTSTRTSTSRSTSLAADAPSTAYDSHFEQAALRHQTDNRVRLSLFVHALLDDFRWLAQDFTSHPTRLAETLPPDGTPEPVWEESGTWNPERRLGHRTTSLLTSCSYSPTRT
jgi:hypothetical protein